ncbi:hypothetical protein [Pseudonocardia parietis]|uniref:Uncharacterized protein n=1 Tax=Pseudonocardia parietis TaxID=570936 RepID=A0ABS4W563_9PSEU|nr:hypothetical protein [Pseudonocardia parietis]MBP2371362.1 hypothetical protein [Pseudonocardia parietis]
MTAVAEASRDRLVTLVVAHRSRQATYRRALAAEDRAEAAACVAALERIAEAVGQEGEAALAAALGAEGTAGAVLLTLLTCDDDVSQIQVRQALVGYQRDIDAVDSVLAASVADAVRAGEPWTAPEDGRETSSAADLAVEARR